MDWFLYDRDYRHERVKLIIKLFISSVSRSIYYQDTVCEISGFVLLSPEANLEPHQTFTKEHFCKNS